MTAVLMEVPGYCFSAERLQALQLELTSVQLLRQQLESSILANEQLREQLEQDMQGASQSEGAVEGEF